MQDTYADKKRARHDTQTAHLAAIQSLPTRAQASAFFGLWPERLPRLVRRKISSEILTGWRALREDLHDNRWDAIHEMLKEDEEESARAATMEFLREHHGTAAREISTLISSLSNLKSMTVVAGGESLKIDLLQSDDEEDDILDMIAFALHVGGGITVRQASSLRTQVKNTKGVMEWVQQERVYGIACGEGRWAAISEADMRTAYNHDQAGNVLPRDPATTFGSLKDYIRKISSHKKH